MLNRNFYLWWLRNHYFLRRRRWLRRSWGDKQFEGIGRLLGGWVIVLEGDPHFIGTWTGVIVLWRQLESWEFASDK
jgi:hypothetical protein